MVERNQDRRQRQLYAPLRATLPDVYHKCGRCLVSLKVEGHGLPKGWAVVMGRLGKQDELRCEQCVIDVKNGSPEQL
jgi:hypothetical protein